MRSPFRKVVTWHTPLPSFARRDVSSILIALGVLRMTLIEAIQVGDIEEAKELLAKRADLHATDNDGWTALHHAAYRGLSELVSLLVHLGAGINVAEHSGWTPLMEAIRGGHSNTIQTLLNAKADVNIEST